MTPATDLFAELQELVRRQRFGEAARVRAELVTLTGRLLLDSGPGVGLVEHRDGWPEGIEPLGGRPLDEAMDLISRRVMRAEFGDNGRPSSLADPGAVRSATPGNAESRQGLLAPTGSQRGSSSVAADPTPERPPASTYRGPSVNGILPH
jgi:hypothetical protein